MALGSWVPAKLRDGESGAGDDVVPCPTVSETVDESSKEKTA